MLEIDDFGTLQHRPTENALVRAAIHRLGNLVGPQSVQLVLDLLTTDADAETEQNRINALVAAQLWSVFNEVSSPIRDPLQVAEAENYLLSAIFRHFGREAMDTTQEKPHLARTSWAVLNEIVAHLSPDDRARLRTMSLSNPPIDFWMHLAVAPKEQSESPACADVWKVILRTLGSVRQSNRPLGMILAETKFPRDRVSRLLIATGGALGGAIDEAGRWLTSR